MKRALSMFIAIFLFVGLLTGCARRQEPVAEEGRTAEETPNDIPKANEEEPITLRWFHHFGEEGVRRWIDLLIEDFRNKYPHVTVETEATSMDNYITMLKTMIVSDNPPDIFHLPSKPDIQQFMENGYVADLTDQPFMNNLNEAARDSALIDGRRWAMALEQICFAVFYNKDVFEKVGITSVPRTWSEFIEVCETIQAAGIVPIAAGYKEQWTLICDNFADHLPATYGKIPTWSDDLQAGRTTWIEDKGNFSAQLTRLFDRHRFVNRDPFGTDWNQASEMLATGEAAMIINGNWTIDTVKQKNPDARLGTFALPFSDNPEDTKMPIGSSGGLIAYAESPNLEMVMNFFAHITTKEMAEQFQIHRKGMSTVQGLSIDFEPALGDILEYVNNGQIFNISVINRDFSQEFHDTFGDNLTAFLMEDELNVENFLKEMDADFERIRGSATR